MGFTNFVSQSTGRAADVKCVSNSSSSESRSSSARIVEVGSF